MTGPPTVDVRRAGGRPRTATPGVDSRHSLSFGRHYDPADTSYGVLIAHNEDRVEAGSGYPTHPHRDVEIVTWVLEGALVHRDAAGREHLLSPGVVQVMSAGDGITHSETNDAHLVDPRRAPGPVRFVQAWLVPDERGGPPRLARQDVGGELRAGRLVPVVSGRREHAGAVRLGCRSAALHAGRLAPGDVVPLPAAPWVHLFVARGTVALAAAAPLPGTGPLEAGDAARLTGCDGVRITALTAAEVLAWEMHAAA